MDQLIELYRALTNPDQLIRVLSSTLTGFWGYALLCAIVFSETGLLVGFFLPGDSLLFTIGVVVGAGQLNLVAIILALTVAAIIGDATGYYLGYRTGPAIFRKKDGLLFKQEYVTKTQEFYAKHGGKTIIYAKFVPIVRTFAPFMAGVGRMNYPHYLRYNIIGSVAWISSMTIAGYLLGKNEFVRRHFEKFVLLVIFLSITPILIEFAKAKLRPSEPQKVS